MPRFGSVISNLIRSPPREKFQRKSGLPRTLGLASLFFLGVAATIGSGSYSLPGILAAEAGPAAPLAYVSMGIISMFTALCYYEFSGMINSAGGAYSFIQAVFGEFIGFIAGLFIILQFIISMSIISKSWNSFIEYFLNYCGIHLPYWFFSFELIPNYSIYPCAIMLILGCWFLANKGVSDSVTFNNIISSINIIVLIFAIISSFFYIKIERYENYFEKGLTGLMRAQNIAAFAYLGYESVIAFSEEAKNLKRDIPLAMMLTLVFAIIINSFLTFNLIGMAPISLINNEKSVISGFGYASNPFFVLIIGIGLNVALIATTFSCVITVPRLCFSMSRDGMIPKIFTKSDDKGAFRFTNFLTVTIGILVLIFMYIESMSFLTSVLCLLLNVFVCLGIVILRYEKNRHLPKIYVSSIIFLIFSGILGYKISNGFKSIEIGIIASILIVAFLFILSIKEKYVSRTLKCPFTPFIPLFGVITNMITLGSTPDSIFFLTFIIVLIGSGLYLCYGYSNSVVTKITDKSD